MHSARAENGARTKRKHGKWGKRKGQGRGVGEGKEGSSLLPLPTPSLALFALTPFPSLFLLLPHFLRFLNAKLLPTTLLLHWACTGRLEMASNVDHCISRFKKVLTQLVSVRRMKESDTDAVIQEYTSFLDTY